MGWFPVGSSSVNPGAVFKQAESKLEKEQPGWKVLESVDSNGSGRQVREAVHE